MCALPGPDSPAASAPTPPPPTRKAVYGRAAVTSSQPLATAAGLQILARHGNAFDAAIATGAMLAVTEPCSNGIGGDLIALCDDNKSVTAVLGNGASPAALSASMLPEPPVPLDCPHTVTVPGTIAAWIDIKQRYGNPQISLLECLQPAIRAAREGFPVGKTTAFYWKLEEQFLNTTKNGTDLLLLDKSISKFRAPQEGEIFVNKPLARVLEDVGNKGRAAFYEGPVAQAMVDILTQLGAVMSMQDLACHQTVFTQPISTTYRGRTVYEPGPPTHGAIAIMCLNILDKYDLSALPEEDVYHLMIEAVRLSFSTAASHIADPAYFPECVNKFIQLSFGDQLRKRINMSERCVLEDTPSLPKGGTVQFSVIDADGNAVSAVQSNYCCFGTGIVPDGCGFSLQNRGLNFSLDPNSNNYVAGSKRSYHTIIPSLAKLGDWKAAVGVMGSFMQPQAHVQVLHALLDKGMDAQQALDRPRFRVTGCFSKVESGMDEDAVLVEDTFCEKVQADLVRRGHVVRLGKLQQFGKGHVCVRDQRGVVMAGADNRADGVAMAML
ncbi:putative gamma-glutamyltransferase YwrD [Gracilariopsis chorda]|uniref:Putative gamma-glutamyltransferase YwrD n=1 Tax=Gracilariopsis chorda TaxID=448386 RepID=A0A2V3J6A0_9FLOR|nr:putative gamma-glutamyltransferase YwrD [Gracilariopsis chorda]|eukprot:PXF49951.1 putative gamma-glutamyltransferase YwrD [Gracilariopsis chorda]